MDEAQMQQVLEAAQAARANPNLERAELRKIWRELHRLAEAQYEPAIEFFMSCLDDPDSNWRLEAIEDLGFHYPFSAESPITAKVRQLLPTDPDDHIRIAAAHILGIRSKWPEPALVRALTDDPDETVRVSAFKSLLNLAGVPYPTVRDQVKASKLGIIQPTWAEVQRIIAENGIDLAALEQ